MNIFERLFRSTLDHSGDANEMVSDTLRPTERELLEADVVWWKDSAAHWRDAFDVAARLRADLYSALAEIHAQGHDSKSGTARAMARKAEKALKS